MQSSNTSDADLGNLRREIDRRLQNNSFSFWEDDSQAITERMWGKIQKYIGALEKSSSFTDDDSRILSNVLGHLLKHAKDIGGEDFLEKTTVHLQDADEFKVTSVFRCAVKCLKSLSSTDRSSFSPCYFLKNMMKKYIPKDCVVEWCDLLYTKVRDDTYTLSSDQNKKYLGAYCIECAEYNDGVAYMIGNTNDDELPKLISYDNFCNVIAMLRKGKQDGQWFDGNSGEAALALAKVQEWFGKKFVTDLDLALRFKGCDYNYGFFGQVAGLPSIEVLSKCYVTICNYLEQSDEIKGKFLEFALELKSVKILEVIREEGKEYIDGKLSALVDDTLEEKSKILLLLAHSDRADEYKEKWTNHLKENYSKVFTGEFLQYVRKVIVSKEIGVLEIANGVLQSLKEAFESKSERLTFEEVKLYRDFLFLHPEHFDEEMKNHLLVVQEMILKRDAELFEEKYKENGEMKDGWKEHCLDYNSVESYIFNWLKSFPREERVGGEDKVGEMVEIFAKYSAKYDFSVNLINSLVLKNRLKGCISLISPSSLSEYCRAKSESENDLAKIKRILPIVREDFKSKSGGLTAEVNPYRGFLSLRFRKKFDGALKGSLLHLQCKILKKDAELFEGKSEEELKGCLGSYYISPYVLNLLDSFDGNKRDVMFEGVQSALELHSKHSTNHLCDCEFIEPLFKVRYLGACLQFIETSALYEYCDRGYNSSNVPNTLQILVSRPQYFVKLLKEQSKFPELLKEGNLKSLDVKKLQTFIEILLGLVLASDADKKPYNDLLERLFKVHLSKIKNFATEGEFEFFKSQLDCITSEARPNEEKLSQSLVVDACVDFLEKQDYSAGEFEKLPEHHQNLINAISQVKGLVSVKYVDFISKNIPGYFQCDDSQKGKLDLDFLERYLDELDSKLDSKFGSLSVDPVKFHCGIVYIINNNFVDEEKIFRCRNAIERILGASPESFANDEGLKEAKTKFDQIVNTYEMEEYIEELKKFNGGEGFCDKDHLIGLFDKRYKQADEGQSGIILENFASAGLLNTSVQILDIVCQKDRDYLMKALEGEDIKLFPCSISLFLLQLGEANEADQEAKGKWENHLKDSAIQLLNEEELLSFSLSDGASDDLKGKYGAYLDSCSAAWKDATHSLELDGLDGWESILRRSSPDSLLRKHLLCPVQDLIYDKVLKKLGSLNGEELDGFLNALDLVGYIVNKDVSFRTANEEQDATGSLKKLLKILQENGEQFSFSKGMIGLFLLSDCFDESNISIVKCVNIIDLMQEGLQYFPNGFMKLIFAHRHDIVQKIFDKKGGNFLSDIYTSKQAMQESCNEVLSSTTLSNENKCGFCSLVVQNFEEGSSLGMILEWSHGNDERQGVYDAAIEKFTNVVKKAVSPRLGRRDDLYQWLSDLYSYVLSVDPTKIPTKVKSHKMFSGIIVPAPKLAVESEQGGFSGGNQVVDQSSPFQPENSNGETPVHPSGKTACMSPHAPLDVRVTSSGSSSIGGGNKQSRKWYQKPQVKGAALGLGVGLVSVACAVPTLFAKNIVQKFSTKEMVGFAVGLAAGVLLFSLIGAAIASIPKVSTFLDGAKAEQLNGGCDKALGSI